MKGIGAFQKYADLYDPETDGRLKDEPPEGFMKISCQRCEDEGCVYFSRVEPEDKVRYWFLARCDCGQGTLPDMAQRKTGRKMEDLYGIPKWCDVASFGKRVLEKEDVVCMRLHPFAAETGVVPFGILEPVVLKNRRIMKEDREAGAKQCSVPTGKDPYSWPLGREES